MDSTIVIGKNGQLAQSIKKVDNTVTLLGREDIHLKQLDILTSELDSYPIKSIINASGYTSVDKAEDEPAEAYALNETAVENLTLYCSARNIHLVHVSTDYVFSGEKGAPYLVDDRPDPLGVYGASKVAGELALKRLYATNSCIIRTSWVYSDFSVNFVRTMLRLLNSKTEISVIEDQVGTPTSAYSLARACLYASNERIIGTHHFTDSGVCSWYDFAVAISKLGEKYGLLNTNCTILPITTDLYPTKAKRPSFSILSKATLANNFERLVPAHWQLELEKVIAEIAKQKE